ncbi:MAG: mitochondrial fission ELM1 family protein [Caulobacteraceae bacterium]|nr:mitochondrial fission ELM1 family protein [Caulobacteraceae bacterium]
MSALDVWFMTTGEAGYRTQARGLARAISPDARELVVDLRGPWRWLPGAMAPFALAGLDPARDRPAPPWPDLLVTCGRRTTALSIAIRRASGGRTATVHVQNPLTRLSAFDLVVAMDHDRIAGPNVISLPTALHDVTAERLAAAAEAWRGRLAPDGRPLLGVLLGGSTRHEPFTAAQAERLLQGLARARAGSGARLAVTPSRRTPPQVRALLAERLAGDPDAYVWDFEGENPYLGILALSRRIVATADSVSMISEALATSAGVEVFGPEGGRKQAEFVAGLVARGLVRRFEGDPAAPPARAPVDSTGVAAQAVRRMLAARTGASG